MGDHDAPVTSVGVLGGLNRLGKAADLVDLEQKSVAGLKLNSLLDAQRVGHGQVITNPLLDPFSIEVETRHLPNNLEVGSLVEVAPSLPVVLREGVLNADDGVLAGQLLVEVGQLLVGEPLGGVAVGVLEVEVVLLGLGLVELARGNIKRDLNLAGVAGLLDGAGDQFEGLIGSLDIRGDTTLVTNVASRLAILLLGQSLELVVNFSTLAKTLGE